MLSKLSFVGQSHGHGKLHPIIEEEGKDVRTSSSDSSMETDQEEESDSQKNAFAEGDPDLDDQAEDYVAQLFNFLGLETTEKNI